MRDSKYEAWMEGRGVKFDYVEAINIDDILIDEDTIFNIRLTTTLDEDTIIRYGVALENGDRFPAIVVFPLKDQWGLINGLHRTKAYDLAGRKTIDAYVVKNTDIDMVDTLRRTANVPEGLPLGVNASLMHAMHLVVTKGHTSAEAARLVGQPAARVDAEMQHHRTREVLTEQGFDPGEFDRSALGALHLVLKRPGWLKRLASLKKRARLPSLSIRTMAQQLGDVDSDEAGNILISKFEAEQAERIARTLAGLREPRPSAYTRLPDAMAQTEKLLKKAGSIGNTRMPAQQMTALADRMDGLVAELQTMIVKLRTSAREVDRASA